MTKIKAEVVSDSLNPQGDRLTSLLITFPRIILAEINTHRMLSKNTSSSRAIPFKKMVEAIQNNPFIPIAFQKHHKGMQGNEYLQGEDLENALDRWNDAKNYALDQAKDLYNTGTTKQLCNRVLEPFMWTTMLITGSKEGWDNFFELRCPQYVSPVDIHFRHKSKKDVISAHSNPINLEKFKNFTDLDWLKINKGQAEIHMMALAEAIYDAMNESIPKQLKSGEWHIPFGDKISWDKCNEILSIKEFKEIVVFGQTQRKVPNDIQELQVKISTAMAARTSYTVVGDEKEINYEKMIELHDRLISQNPPHSSPMEHCARAMSDEEYYSWIKGKVPTYTDDYGIYNIEYYPVCYKESINFDGTIGENPNNGDKFGWCRNFKGFIPYRHIIENQKRI